MIWKTLRHFQFVRGIDNLTSVSVAGSALNRYAYDGFGNRVAMTAPNGATTRYRHDSRGRVVEDARPDGTVIGMGYHPSGKLAKRTVSTRHCRDLTETWEWGGGEVLKKSTTPAGTRRYKRNSCGKLGGIEFAGDEAGFDVDLDYTTDVAGRVTSISGDGGIRLNYAYDADGYVTSVKDAAGRETLIEYDAMKREIRRVMPNGEVIDREYNSAGWIVRQTHTIRNRVTRKTWEHDDLGRVIAYTDGPDRWTYAYDTQDQLLRATTPAGVATSYSYDTHGNIEQITITQNDSPLSSSMSN